MKPVLKWAGGKTQLLDRLESRVPEEYNRYYEPFIGGGALLLDLGPEREIINDCNMQLLNVYRQIRDGVEDLISLVHEFDAVPCTKERYYEMRDKYNGKISGNVHDIECAALTIWINKHCFNGLYRVNKKGSFNVPWNNKQSGDSISEENLREISDYLRNNDITILEGDFEAGCEGVGAGDFVYFDSPYVPESDTANFTDYTKTGFEYDDHVRLSRLFRKLSDRGAMVMLSNNNVPLVHELYAGFNIYETDVARMINRNPDGRKGKEVIITNY